MSVGICHNFAPNKFVLIFFVKKNLSQILAYWIYFRTHPNPNLIQAQKRVLIVHDPAPKQLS